MRILFVSDAPWQASGYGNQTDLVTHLMQKDGHQVLIYAPGALHEGQVPLPDGRVVLSSSYGDDRWGNLSYPYILNRAKPDLVITWLDAQGLGNFGKDPTPTYMWAPIDSQPIPYQERGLLHRADRLMVPSQWGQCVLRSEGFEADYVPCGVNLAALRVDSTARAAFRQRNGVKDDEWLIGMVGQNRGSPDRKGYCWAFDVLAEFVKRHPKGVKIYIHTDPVGDFYAPNLTYLRKELGLLPYMDFPRITGPWAWAGSWMNEMYNAFDVLFHTSLGEGFGVPLVEAQACGTPVVVNSATAVEELSVMGYQAPPSEWVWSQTITRWAHPDRNELLVQLERAYEDREKLDRRTIREFIQGNFEFTSVYARHWRPILDSVPNKIEWWLGERKLLLGCGKTEKPGFSHHDREALWPHIDTAHDLTIFPWPWDDNTWDYIEAIDVLEHLRGEFTAVMDELWRILAPGGYIYIHVPEVGSWQHMEDPTHVRGFTVNAFDYYTERGWGDTYPYSSRKWSIVKKWLDDSGVSVVMTPLKETE